LAQAGLRPGGGGRERAMFNSRHEPNHLPPLKEILASIVRVNKSDLKQPRRLAKKYPDPVPAPQRKVPFYGGDKVSRMFSFLPYTDIDIIIQRGSDPPYGYPRTFAKVVPEGTPPPSPKSRHSSKKGSEPDGGAKKKKKNKRPPFKGMVYPSEMPPVVDAGALLPEKPPEKTKLLDVLSLPAWRKANVNSASFGFPEPEEIRNWKPPRKRSSAKADDIGSGPRSRANTEVENAKVEGTQSMRMVSTADVKEALRDYQD